MPGGDTVIGRLGTVTHPIKKDKPGEISIMIRGGSEIYTAYSDAELNRGCEVVVVSQISARTLMVSAF